MIYTGHGATIENVAYVWMLPRKDDMGILVQVYEAEKAVEMDLEYRDTFEESFPEHEGKLIGFAVHYEWSRDYFGEYDASISASDPVVFAEDGLSYLLALLSKEEVDLTEIDLLELEEWLGKDLELVDKEVEIKKVEFAGEEISITTPSPKVKYWEEMQEKLEESEESFVTGEVLRSEDD